MLKQPKSFLFVGAGTFWKNSVFSFLKSHMIASILTKDFKVVAEKGAACDILVGGWAVLEVTDFCKRLKDRAIHGLVLAAGVTALQSREDTWPKEARCKKHKLFLAGFLVACWQIWILFFEDLSICFGSVKDKSKRANHVFPHLGDSRWLWDAFRPQLPLALQHGGVLKGQRECPVLVSWESHTHTHSAYWYRENS